MKWYIKVLRNYARLSGRATRKEYWMFFLFNGIISFILGTIEVLLHFNNWLGLIYGLAIFIPSISVAVRRLHDSGKSGYWMWLQLIPFGGAIVIFVFLCFDSQKGTNKYGPYPKSTKLEENERVGL